MMRVIVNGACGHMGHEVLRVVEQSENACLAAAVDSFGGEGVYTSLTDDLPEADILIDFSHHTAVYDILAFAKKRSMPVIIATTGHTDDERDAIHAACGEIPVFFSANMSLGVALLVRLAKKTASVFPDADIEIVETHHNRKLDAPSGTAMLLANAIREVRTDAELVFGRSGMSKRKKGEIGMHCLRMGNIVGIHEVHVCTQSQTITLRHEAHDRSLFADGALAAAEFMIGKPAGLYTMQDLI